MREHDPEDRRAARPSWTPRVFGGGLRFGHTGAVGGLRGATLGWTIFHLGSFLLCFILLETAGPTFGLSVPVIWAFVILIAIVTRGPRLRRRLRREAERQEREEASE